MKSEFIIDSSALLMAIYQENEDIEVNEYFKSAVMHHVNISEVMNVLIRDGMAKNHAIEVIQKLIPKTIGTNIEDAYLAAQIKAENKPLGISTGDSFCLAAALRNDLIPITADKIWKKLELGIEIICIR